MVRIALLLMVLVGAIGCAPNPGPLFINSFNVMTPAASCGVPDQLVPVRRGLVNVSGSADYWAAVEITGADNIAAPAVVSGSGQTLEPSNRDRVVLDSYQLTYASTPPIPGLPTQPEVMRLGLPMEQGPNVFPFNLIGPQASAAIATGVQESNELSQATVLVTSIELVGHMSGSGTTLRSGRFPFEVLLLNTPDPGCPDKIYARDTMCLSTGQDTLTRPACCPPAGTAGAPYGCP